MPDSALLKHGFANSSDWELFNEITQSANALKGRRQSQKQIAKILNDLQIPFDPEDLNAWWEGHH